MKIKAIMLGLAVSGVLLFGDGLNLEQSQQEIIDNLDIDPLNPRYIKLLMKNLVETSQVVGMNSKAVLYHASLLKEQKIEIQLLKRQIKQLQTEINKLNISLQISP